MLGSRSERTGVGATSVPLQKRGKVWEVEEVLSEIQCDGRQCYFDDLTASYSKTQSRVEGSSTRQSDC